MHDYGLSVLEQYDVSVKNSFRGRGALLCQTDKGLLLIREFKGSARKLERQQKLLEEIQNTQEILTDIIWPNREGELVSSSDGTAYVVRRWYEGKECDTRSQDDILRSVRALGALHKAMHLPLLEEYAAQPLTDKYARHNRELKKIRKFIRQKRRKNEFETTFLSSVEWFLEQGEEALWQLTHSSYENLRKTNMENGNICHGEYNQHNVLMLKSKEAVTNFEHWNYDLQTADLYRFMRKILEKYNWEERLAARMLEEYQKVKPLSTEEWENLRIQFCYPEKYWKLGNYYYTHNKAWISGKNTEKLRRLIDQKEAWKNFGKKCFGN